MSYNELKKQQRNERERYSDNLGLRVHRALSWLNRSEQEEKDPDVQFIFLWIAFNAAYANEFQDQVSVTETNTFQLFINRLCELDKDDVLYKLVWDEFSSTIRILLENKYVFKGFWDFHRGIKSEEDWKNEFISAKSSANRALGKKDTSKVLAIVFSRLYVLRNQMLHGGATWNSSVNIDQKRDAVNFLSKFVPEVIKIMMDNYSEVWGTPFYPVIKD